ncbi:2Fe-2S iron-sulfur cluster-binding protein [Mycolicibacterium sp. jd]|uniref:Oxidoreductase n=3 Tax=Mycobacteriaceae TaxID=1762 RepID=A0A1Y0CGL4_9MYCO|nr:MULTISPECIES: 2Fe-2S iron-sulfur cluster-binding protein [Mycobacteriaceae]QPA35672.1 class 6 soluble di-iron monooxygenase reductase [Mycolicibacterium mageritense]ART74429.1 oxidoreductase [Mycobacterium dioxanotrophicus]MDN4521293.1 2Fe-2S iron-sulfur cluster-binding protein [Mycolicibacterium austroafricanum]UJL30622.1 2Fe-2S iron-sulfur cluster binding domain-containing protein [Mycolicibacterium vanbaalenii]WND56273.1 2Fe-2S iron-sulfur cluster-binding protein [Mycolicibacterium vanba
MARVTLVPTGEEFPVGENEDILTAALHHGVNLQYGCRHGNCSSCKHWLLDGDVDDSAASVYAIPRNEREDGAILLCCTYAESDLVIEIDQHDGAEALPPMTPPSPRRATVLEVISRTSNLVELRVALDAPLSFRAGQYAEFTLDTGERRSYSLLNPPSSGSELTFCIKRVQNGVFTAVLDQLEPGYHLHLEAPFGTMFLRETGRPVIAVGTGSGIAPLLSMLSDAAEQNSDVPIRFYYGARTTNDLVYLDKLAELSTRLKDFQFIPCLSQGTPETVPPNARAGRVTRAIAEDIRDASLYDAYLCGAPEMCDAVGRLLEAKGLPEVRIHADKFYPAIESAPVSA